MEVIGVKNKNRLRQMLKICVVLLLFLLCFHYAYQGRKAVTIQTEVQSGILLDAGHGGEDGGAVSASGVKESEINLSIVLRMEQLMAFMGESPSLLRREDRSLHEPHAVTLREKKVSDLKSRVAMANAVPDAVLISIHQNSYPEPKYKGTQVFFAPTPGSEQLAQRVQQSVLQELQPYNKRAEKQIPKEVYLMNHINNRAILIECGFLTNPEEEQLLRTLEYQKKMALAISCSILNSLR